MIEVGRVVRPQGNRGEVVIASSTDFGAERFREGAVLHVLREGRVEPMTVTSSREYDGRWIVGYEGIASIDAAETLRGAPVRIPAEELTPLEAGRHYVHDLVGCRVETDTGAAVGSVSDVQFGTGVPLLVVDDAGAEVLIPFTEAVCRSVDVAGKRIVIDPPEGLLEVNKRS